MSLLTTLLAGALLALPQQDPAPPPEAVLSIDGRPISFAEFTAWLVPYQGEVHVGEFAFLVALERAAGAEQALVPREAVLARVEQRIQTRVAGAFGGDLDAWRAELARLDQDEAEFRAQAELDAWQTALVEGLIARRRKIEEPALRALWEQRYGPGGQSPVLGWLFLKVEAPPQPEGAGREQAAELARAARAAVEARAIALHAELVAGADFGALAREHSDDPHSRATGGAPPAGTRPRDFGSDAAATIGALGKGELSAPLYARGGFHLFRVVDFVHTPFESVRAELERELRAAPPNAGETEALRTELLGGLPIEILPELGRAPGDDPSDPSTWRMDRPVLRVGDELVSRERFAGWLCAARGKPYVRAYAEKVVVAGVAERAGVQVSRADIERRITDDTARSIEVYFHGDREAWLQHLAERGLSEAIQLRTQRIQTRHELLAERCMIATRTLTEAQLVAAWEDRYGPGGRSADVRFLMREMQSPAEGEVETQEQLERFAAAERARVIEMLDGLRERIANGEDFGTLVALYSQDPRTRDEGGRPPGRFELHTWPADIQEAIGALRPGQVSAPLELGYSYFLFQLVGERVVKLDEVREALTRELLEARPSMPERAGWANAQLAQHEVRTLPGLYARRPGPKR